MSARGSLRQAVSDFVFEAASALSGKSPEEYAADVVERAKASARGESAVRREGRLPQTLAGEGGSLGLPGAFDNAPISPDVRSESAANAMSSPWDLNADWEAFQASQKGEKR